MTTPDHPTDLRRRRRRRGGRCGLRRRELRSSSPCRPRPSRSTIIDVAGNLALTQKAIENYRKAKPEPRLAHHLHQGAGAGAAGQDQGAAGCGPRRHRPRADRHRRALRRHRAEALGRRCCRHHAAALPKLDDIYLPAAAKMQALAKGQGVVVTYYPSGPLLEYMPDKVKTRADDGRGAARLDQGEPEPLPLCAPGQFRPRPHLHDGPALHPRRQATRRTRSRAGTRPGPISRSSAQNIEYYPTGTGATMKELGEGSRDMIASTTGWDINPRVLGIVPKEAKVGALKGFHWVADAHYMCVPKGVAERQARGAARPDELPAQPRSSRPTPTTRAISIPARP